MTTGLPARSTESGAAGRLLIASSDGHAGMPASAYKQYIAKRYWPAVDEMVEAEEWSIAAIAEMIRFPDDELELIDRERAIRDGGCEATPDG